MALIARSAAGTRRDDETAIKTSYLVLPKCELDHPTTRCSPTPSSLLRAARPRRYYILPANSLVPASSHHHQPLLEQALSPLETLAASGGSDRASGARVLRDHGPARDSGHE